METKLQHNFSPDFIAPREGSAVILLNIRDDDSIFQKVSELFTCRRLDEYAELLGVSSRKKKDIFDKLFFLQRVIYALDFYGESNWQIDRGLLKLLWNDICKHLGRWSLDDRTVIRLIKDMRIYQEIEIGLRRGILPSVIPIRQFYHYKTCDVRIARYLISSQCLSSVEQMPMAELWNYYDLISEVYDDLSDLEEDMYTFNCNRFLLLSEFLGIDKTRKAYEWFILELQDDLESALNNTIHSSEIVQLKRWFSETKETITILLEYWQKNSIGLKKSSLSI